MKQVKTSGFVPLHIFLDTEGGYKDLNLVYAMVMWANALYEMGYEQKDGLR